MADFVYLFKYIIIGDASIFYKKRFLKY